MIWSQAEQLDRNEMRQLQLERLQRVVDRAYRNVPFYQKRLDDAGVRPEDIRSLADIARIPFTVKTDLRDTYPFGMFAAPLNDIVRFHCSSGTTGKPIVIGNTQNDILVWQNGCMRALAMCGVRSSDVMQVAYGYGLFTGGLGLHYGAERLGVLVIPSGSGNTKRQLQLMKDFGTTVLHATPSYMFHLAGKITEFGLSRKDLSLKKAFLGAEPYSENTRKKIEELFGIEVYNSYGLSEMNGPGVAFECVYKNGMHLWEDAYILEVIDPATGETLPDGQEGELVLTTLKREATPLLRYRTRDRASVYADSCSCGRTHRRISRITGRTDDMMIVNGANVFPSQIEQVIMQIPEVGTNYQVCLTKAGALDRMIVQVEIYSKIFQGDVAELEKLKRKIREELKANIVIAPDVELHEPGSLPVYEMKSKRVVDMRPKI